MTPGVVALQRTIAISGTVFFAGLMVIQITKVFDGSLWLDGRCELSSRRVSTSTERVGLGSGCPACVS